MNNAIETIDYKGYKIEVFYDETPESPREWDNLGKMVFNHNRYNFPNDANIDFDDFDSWKEIADYLKKEEDAVIVLPVQMYEHSGVRIYVGNSHDKWDGGELGVVYATAQDLIAENIDYANDEGFKQAKNILTGEVDNYSKYINGEVYGYILTDEDGENVDGCWDFYDDPKNIVDELKSTVDRMHKQFRYKVAKNARELHK